MRINFDLGDFLVSVKTKCLYSLEVVLFYGWTARGVDIAYFKFVFE